MQTNHSDRVRLILNVRPWAIVNTIGSNGRGNIRKEYPPDGATWPPVLSSRPVESLR